MSLQDLGIKVNNKDGWQRSTCPQCSHTRKKSNDLCLTYNQDLQAFHCFHCGWSGIAENKFKEIEKPQGLKNIKNINEITAFFESRKINFETLQRFKIISKDNRIGFPFFYFDKLINIKYRSLDKHFSQVKDADKIPFNYNDLINTDYIVIVEGEMDALTVSQCGFKVISLPDGGFSGKAGNKLKWLDNTYKEFEKIDKIYLALDNDEVGRNTQEELARRLGKSKCYRVKFPEGTKDFNELFISYGEKAVKELIKKAIPYPIEGFYSINDKWDSINYIYHNGYDKGAEIPLIDKFQFFTKYLNLFTGIPSHGKSTFLFNVLIELSKYHEWKHIVFSPEHQIENTYIKLIRILKGDFFRLTENELHDARKFINQYFVILEPLSNKHTIDEILNKTSERIKQYGVNTLNIDPWNTIEHNWNRNTNETNYISFALQRLKDYGKENDILVNLVAHPTKVHLNGKERKPTLYDIAGSANFYNKLDNGFIVYRDEKGSVVTIQKIKENHIGTTGDRNYHFNLGSEQYTLLPKEEKITEVPQEINIF